MRLAVVIDQIKAQCPSFSYVGHILESNEEIAYPAALVGPVKSIASENDALEVNIQQVTDLIGVWIVLSRRRDGVLDYGAADELDDLREELRAGLILFSPDPAEYEPLSYAGGMLAPYAPGVSTWREDFKTEFQLRVTP
jgi:hypothetical protein